MPEEKRPPFLQTNPLVGGLVALVIGGLAEYLLRDGQTLMAAFGYLVAVILFVRSLRALVPEAQKFPASDEARSSVFSGLSDLLTRVRAMAVAKSSTLANPPTPPVVGSEAPRSESGIGSTPQPASPIPSHQPPARQPPIPSSLTKPDFWTHWRYYTINNLIRGTKPDIPGPPAPEIIEPITSQPLPVEPAPSTPFVIPSTETAAHPVDANYRTAQLPESTPPPFSPTQPSAPELAPPAQPRVMIVAPQGEVIVVDITKNLVFRFDPQGNLLKQQPVARLPALTANDLTLSPDGKTLYIFDAEGQSLQVVSLA